MGDLSEIDRVIQREECDRLSSAVRSSRPSDPVHIADCGGGKVEIDHQIDSFEVNAATHQLGADQEPDLAHSKVPDDVVSLRLCAIRMNHIDVNSVVDQLLEEFLVWKKEKNFN